MEIIFEILFGFVGEFLLQIVGELLIEMGLHSVDDAGRGRASQRSPWLAAVGYVGLGACVGALSLLVFPDLWVTHPTLRMVNLLVSPVAAGVGMALVGKWRAKRGQAVLRIDKFAYGYLFAFGLGFIRFVFAG
jgi:hypothetical protein